MIGATNLHRSAPEHMAGVTAGPDDDNWESLNSFELVIRAKGGDEKARDTLLQDTLLQRYYPRLRRWAHGRLSDGARGAYETHDLVQEALLQVVNNLHKFNPRHEGAFQGYVRTILFNRIRDLGRQATRRGTPLPLDTELAGREVSPLDQAIGTQTRERYEAALARLRPEDRELIIARLEMGLPYKELVVMFGRPSVSAVTMAVRRALVRLAEGMANERER
jgi:RNA polymerase sigma-70 factor, ECF subfamily